MSNRNRRKRRTEKSRVDWIEGLVQFLTGLLTGIILLIIDYIFFS